MVALLLSMRNWKFLKLSFKLSRLTHMGHRNSPKKLTFINNFTLDASQSIKINNYKP